MEFPKKCIKCKASNLQLTNFQYVKINKKREMMITIPVCEFCKKEIVAFKKYEDIYSHSRL